MAELLTVWIDNDGCPVRIREIVFKAAARVGFPLKIVANRYMHPPRGVNAEVIVAGKLAGNTFQAQELVAKCPSKYEAEEKNKGTY